MHRKSASLMRDNGDLFSNSIRSGFRGRFHSKGVFAFALARDTPHRNDYHRGFCWPCFVSLN